MTGTFFALASASPCAIRGASTAMVMTASTPCVRSSGSRVDTTAGLLSPFLTITSQCSFSAAACTLFAQRASDSEPVLMTMTPIFRGFRASFAAATVGADPTHRARPQIPAIFVTRLMLFLPNALRFMRRRTNFRIRVSCVRTIRCRRGPFAQRDEIGINGDARSDRARIDRARVAIDRQDVALPVHRVAAAQGGSVDLDAHDTADGRHAPGARDDGGMAHHSAESRQNALGGAHAVDVLGRGLPTYEKHVLASLGELNGAVGIKDNLAAGGAG